MAIPANGYLGDPARTTQEMQDGFDDLTEALNDPATGLDAANSAASDAQDSADAADTAAGNAQSTADGAIPKSGGTATGQISGISPVSAANLTRKDYVDDRVLSKSWVSKWTGSSTFVTNSFGDGEYILKASNDMFVRVSVTSDIGSAGYTGGDSVLSSTGGQWTAIYENFSSRFVINFISSGGSPSTASIVQVWKAE